MPLRPVRRQYASTYSFSLGMPLVLKSTPASVPQVSPSECQRKELDALGGREIRQAGVAKDAALQIIHHIKCGADNVVVLAQQAHLWHRHVRAFERLHDTIFAVDLMRAR